MNIQISNGINYINDGFNSNLCEDGRIWKNWTKERNVLSGCDRHL